MESMAEFTVLLSRLGVGAIGTFFAILLWSQTRQAPWVLVIIGTLVSYAAVVYATLERFGIVSVRIDPLPGFPLLEVLLANLPMVFYICAFISMLARRRVRSR
jgi:hypothetical protein